ncbi:hypothetical protein MSG28_015048 [Choristoneura fumiferana]|uniref:Uncharacterized protein n=1 Tax=Choristoneura fumiferana TaxID=7141 RepID=A0ACC0KYB3_CHOFU|nr:hypothetical protein MSG28_015048 [Choristoneura fumiferana]
MIMMNDGVCEVNNPYWELRLKPSNSERRPAPCRTLKCDAVSVYSNKTNRDGITFNPKEMVDYIADYLENIRDRRVYPDVQPGYLHKLLPGTAPAQPESWDDIFKDVDQHIMPGLVHWQSPHMHAYFPALTSYPSIMGDMLSSALNVLCFTWASSPAGTELETIAMNWLGKILGLPESFLNEKNDSPGGGVIQRWAYTVTWWASEKPSTARQTEEMVGRFGRVCKGWVRHCARSEDVKRRGDAFTQQWDTMPG